MSIGFSFTGKVKAPESLIEAAQKLAEEEYYRLNIQKDGLRLALCPLGGNLYVNWSKGNDRQYEVEGSCCSTPAGPGLHQAAVEALDALGIQNLVAEDETGYYDHRDFAQMCREHFYYPWLTTIVDVCWRRKDELNHMCVCWDTEQYMPEDIPGTVITPMGRFPLEWLKSTLEREGPEALAARLCLWVHPGEWDALFHRNLALNQLWGHCYFAPSTRSGEDAALNNAICANLELAAQLDSSLPLPRSAYAEVCALAGREPVLPDGPELELAFEPGYRKGAGHPRRRPPAPHAARYLPIRVGGVGRKRQKKGCHKWWDDANDSPVWRVNGYRRKNGSAAFTPMLQNDNDLAEFAIRDGAVRYGWQALEADGQPYYQVRAEVVTGPALHVITVSHRRPEERSGIVALVRKITVSTQDTENDTVPVQR